MSAPLRRPLRITRYTRTEVRESYAAVREALFSMREQRYRVRLLEEDAPLFIALELSRGDAHLHVTGELLPSGDGGSELELRLEGSVPSTGMASLMKDPQRAIESLQKRILSKLKRALGRKAWTDDESTSFTRLRRALRETRKAAELKRERRAEVESAFAAGLINEEERDRLLARVR